MSYSVQGTVEWAASEDYAGMCRQIPTFYLHENVQGIVSADHARRVALDVVDPTGRLRADGATFHLHIERI